MREMKDGGWLKMKKRGVRMVEREYMRWKIDDSIINKYIEIYDKISPWNLTPFLSLSYF